MDQKLGRDPNGVAVFGGIVRRFVQLSKNENSMRKILIGNSEVGKGPSLTLRLVLRAFQPMVRCVCILS